MLCKCSGKYIDIYFNLKITFFSFFLKAFRFPESFTLYGRLLNNLGALYLKLLAYSFLVHSVYEGHASVLLTPLTLY